MALCRCFSRGILWSAGLASGFAGAAGIPCTGSRGQALVEQGSDFRKSWGQQVYRVRLLVERAFERKTNGNEAERRKYFQQQAQNILSSSGTKAIELNITLDSFVKKGLARKDMKEGLERGWKTNSVDYRGSGSKPRNVSQEYLPQYEKLQAILEGMSHLNPGDKILFCVNPDSVTIYQKVGSGNYVALGSKSNPHFTGNVVEGKGFGNFLLSFWLGHAPSDDMPVRLMGYREGGMEVPPVGTAHTE